jgi:hypothetical protein
VERTADAALEVRIMLPRGAMYVDTTLPCAWGVVLPPPSWMPSFGPGSPSERTKTSRYGPSPTARFSRKAHSPRAPGGACGLVSRSRETLKTFEAQMARHLHRHFEIGGWGNEPAVKKLLAVRYNITI